MQLTAKQVSDTTRGLRWIIVGAILLAPNMVDEVRATVKTKLGRGSHWLPETFDRQYIGYWMLPSLPAKRMQLRRRGKQLTAILPGVHRKSLTGTLRSDLTFTLLEFSDKKKDGVVIGGTFQSAKVITGFIEFPPMSAHGLYMEEADRTGTRCGQKGFNGGWTSDLLTLYLSQSGRTVLGSITASRNGRGIADEVIRGQVTGKVLRFNYQDRKIEIRRIGNNLNWKSEGQVEKDGIVPLRQILKLIEIVPAK